MSSREHARRLMLILLSGDAAPLRLDEAGTAGERDDRREERPVRPGEDRAEASGEAAHRRKETLIAAYAWT